MHPASTNAAIKPAIRFIIAVLPRFFCCYDMPHPPKLCPYRYMTGSRDEAADFRRHGIALLSLAAYITKEKRFCFTDSVHGIDFVPRSRYNRADKLAFWDGM